MLKCGIHVLAPSLTILFNFILKTGNCPDAWSNIQIRWQVWAFELQIDTEVRICVTSCLGKLFCSLLNKRLSNFVEANNLTHSSQIGLIKGLIEQLITFLVKNFNRQVCIVHASKGKRNCFVDFQKAFDSVWHNGLLYKLLENKICANLIISSPTCI